jgi:7-cyano-7-deazaguanine synthase
LHHYKLAAPTVRALFVDYGHRAAEREAAAVTEIANCLGVDITRVGVSGLSIPRGEITGRNALLLTVGLMTMGTTMGVVAIGVHAGTDYADCSPSFIRQMQLVFDTYTGGRVRIGAPFMDWLKGDIFRYSLEAGLPTSLTYSCEEGGMRPCGVCRSCHDAEAINAM